MTPPPKRASFEQRKARAPRQPPSYLSSGGQSSGVASVTRPPGLTSISDLYSGPFVDLAKPLGTVPTDEPDVSTQNHLRSPSVPSFPPLTIPEDEPDVLQAENIPAVQVDARFNQGPLVLGEDFFVLLKELVDLREKDIKRRIHLKNGLRDIEYQWQHAAKAQESFMMACASFMSIVNDPTTPTFQDQSAQEAWKQLQNLSGHIRSREMDLAKSLNDLFKLENRLYMKEQSFYDRLENVAGPGVFSDDESDEWLGETDDLTALPAPSSDSSASTRSIAHMYYSRVGDINLLRERIFNFDSEHRRQKAIREAQRNNGIRVQPTDKAFYKKFLEEKEAMVKEYVFTKEKMEELREDCNRQGVEVEPPNLTPFLDNSFRAQRSLQGSGHDADDEDKAEKSNRFRSSKNERRIDHWVRDIRTTAPIKLPEKDTFVFLSETTDPRTLGWAEEQAESFVPFPLHAHIKPPTFDPKTLTGAENTRYSKTKGSDMFPGETPSHRYSQAPCKSSGVQRRYSMPALPTFHIYSNLQDGILDFLDDDYLDISSKSHIQK